MRLTRLLKRSNTESIWVLYLATIMTALNLIQIGWSRFALASKFSSSLKSQLQQIKHSIKHQSENTACQATQNQPLYCFGILYTDEAEGRCVGQCIGWCVGQRVSLYANQEVSLYA